MSINVAGVQATSAFERLKRKYSWNDDKIIPSNACPSVMPSVRLMPKSKEYQVPQLFLLYSNKSCTPTEAIKNFSWLELDLGVTELAGEAGSGKTQISLGLCISCVMQSYSLQLMNPVHTQTEITHNNQSNISPTSTPLNFIQPPLQTDTHRKQHVSNNPYQKISHGFVSLDVSSSSFTSSSSSHSIAPILVNKNPYLKSSIAANLPPSDNHKNVRSPRGSTVSLLAKTTTALFHTKHEACKLSFYRAIYISMGEGVSESQRAYRLNQMYMARRLTVDTNNTANGFHTALSRIVSKSIYNEEDFHEWLYEQLPDMLALSNSNSQLSSSNIINKLEGERIGIIVIDSMAGLFRIPDDKQSSSWYIRRSGLLFQAAAQLKKISFQYSVPIVVVNQVSASEQGPSTPALGFSWSHCVNSRYLISRKEKYVSNKDEEGKTDGRTIFSRRIELAFSPHYPSLLDCYFVIDNEGCKLKEFSQ